MLISVAMFPYGVIGECWYGYLCDQGYKVVYLRGIPWLLWYVSLSCCNVMA